MKHADDAITSISCVSSLICQVIDLEKLKWFMYVKVLFL